MPEDNGDPLNPASAAYDSVYDTKTAAASDGELAAFPSADEWSTAGISRREYIATRALHGLLAYHGCGYDPYMRKEDGDSVDESDPYIQQLRAKSAARCAENKLILAREAVAYADALIAALNE